MKYCLTTKELLTVLHASGLEATPASPFRTLMTLPQEGGTVPLSEENRLLAAFALTPERTLVIGRHSSADGVLYLLKIGALWYAYSRMEKQDLHVFYAYFDRPSLLRFLQKNFAGFYKPNFGAFTQANLRLTADELTVWNLIRALEASRTKNGIGTNRAFTADDLKEPDLTLYLRNYLDELGMKTLSNQIRLLMDEKHHQAMETALKGLEEKGVLTEDLALKVEHNEPAYRLTRTAIERLDDGMLIDTVWFSDQTDPQATKELLFCLRRDGVLAMVPTPDGGGALRSFTEIPWSELI